MKRITLVTLLKSRLAVVLVAVMLGLIMTTCGGGGGGDAADPNGAGDDVGGDGGGENGGGGGGGSNYGSGADPVSDPSGDPTSYDLINTALEAGTISTEQALLYKLFVQFDDPALPADYRGDDLGYIEADAQHQVISYINEVGADNIAAAALDTMRRFFLPPFYEGSWWHLQNPGATTAARPAGNRTAAANPNCRPWEEYCSKLTNWASVGGTHVVVWYPVATETVDAPRANILVQEMDNSIWPKLTALMGRTPISDVGTGLVSETDGRLDVILVDMPDDNEGLTNPSTVMGCQAVPAHIYLNRNLPMHGLLANAAHELMHAIQFSYAVTAQCVTDYYTILEATAVWAIHYVDPTNDWEHKYAKSYLKGSRLSKPYDDKPKTEPSLVRYGAYVFPLFLQTRYGATIVKEIWDQTQRYSQELFAIEGALLAHNSSFDKEWPKFIAANWNRETIDTYRTSDRLNEAADLNYDDTFLMSSYAAGMGSFAHSVSLPHASAGYYRFVFGDTAARSIMFLNGISFVLDLQDITGWGDTFVFSGLTLLQRSGVSVQAYLKVGGTWQSEPINLTNVMWMTACRDDPAGRIDEIIFMYGNAEIQSTNPNYPQLQPRGASPGMFVSNIGCRDWNGSLSMATPLTNGQETLTISNIVLHNTMDTAAPRPGGEPTTYPLSPSDQISPGFGYVYAITAGTATWTYTDSGAGCTYTGNKTLSITNPYPAHTLSNWTPTGTAGRGTFLTRLLGPTVPSQLIYDWRCVDTEGNVTTGTDGGSTNLDIDVSIDDPLVRIIPSTGLSLSGTDAQTDDPGNVAGTWSFQGLAR